MFSAITLEKLLHFQPYWTSIASTFLPAMWLSIRYWLTDPLGPWSTYNSAAKIINKLASLIGSPINYKNYSSSSEGQITWKNWYTGFSHRLRNIPYAITAHIHEVLLWSKYYVTFFKCTCHLTFTTVWSTTYSHITNGDTEANRMASASTNVSSDIENFNLRGSNFQRQEKKAREDVLS